jgi:predicted DNA-binding WGR domain protein
MEHGSLFRESGINAYTYVLLRAEQPDKNIRREYSIRIANNLFGKWEVQTQWGRTGSRGQSKRYYFPSHKESLKKMAGIIKKRLTSHSRIGCAYKIVESRQF